VVPGVLLTGGRSSRMGWPKAHLRREGTTLAQRAGALLGQVCHPVVEAGGRYSGLPAVPDHTPGLGPVGGLRAAIDALGDPACIVVLGVDLPGMTRDLLDLVASWPGQVSVVPERRGIWQPTCARYGPVALEAARTGRGTSLRQVLGTDPELVVVAEHAWRRVAPARALDDVDTPAEAAAFGIEVPPPGLEDSPG